MHEDFADWVQNNEDDLIQDFIAEHYDDVELALGGLDKAIKNKGAYKDSWEAIRAYIMGTVWYQQMFDEWCEARWRARREGF